MAMNDSVSGGAAVAEPPASEPLAVTLQQTVSRIIEIQKGGDGSGLLADWQIGQQLNTVHLNFGNDGTAKLLEQLKAADPDGAVSTATAYRLRRVANHIDEPTVRRMAALGISTNQACLAIAAGEGVTPEVLDAVLKRIEQKELSRLRFASGVSAAISKKGGAPEIDGANEDTGSRKPATKTGDTSAGEPAPRKRGRPKKTDSAPAAPGTKGEVGVEDSVEAMAGTIMAGLEGAISTCGSVLLLCDKLSNGGEAALNAAGDVISRLQSRFRDFAEAGSKAKEALFVFQVDGSAH